MFLRPEAEDHWQVHCNICYQLKKHFIPPSNALTMQVSTSVTPLISITGNIVGCDECGQISA